MKKSIYGFHLIEILMTIAIIGITASLSFPLYTQYLVQARRVEAKNTLSQLALAMEQYHIEHNSYEDATLVNLNFPEMIAKENYQLSIQNATGQDYLLSAIPLGKQLEKDRECQTLSLNAKNEKMITGHGSIAECWS